MDIVNGLKAWELFDGPALFLSLGVSAGSRVLDFGCGTGHYTVAAAHAAGPAGFVHAVDCSPEAVERLQRRVADEGPGTVSVTLTDGGMHVPAEDCSVDVLLLYDILHMKSLDVPALISEARRVLRPGGVLSILPFHMGEDAVLRLIDCISLAGFTSPAEIPGSGIHTGMLHDAYEKNNACEFDSVEKGTVYNFIRK